MSSNRRPLRQFDNEGSFGFKNKFFHFQGETLDGKPHGPGLLRLSNGVTVQGEFVKGELKGPGTKRWPDGSIFYGTFENGEPHGFGRHFSVQTLQDFEGFYERGYKKGYGKLTDHAQGTVFEGEFLRDFPNGKGVLKALGGDLVSPLCVKGYWENAKLHGLAMATLSNGDTAVGVCEDGLWTGNGAFSTLGTRYWFPTLPNSNTNNLKAEADVVSLNASAATANNDSGNGNALASPISTPLPPPQSDAVAAKEGGGNVASLNANNTLAAAASFLGVRSAIRYKGPMELGCRAEVPDALKLRSAVLLCNRAPLERIDPDTPPGEGGLFLWGAKPPQSPLSATSRRGMKSPPRVSSASPSSPKGRVGALPAFSKGSPKTAANDEDRRKATDTPQLMYKAPCSKPLRLQVSLAKKTYRTFVVDSSSTEEGGGQWSENEGGGRNKNIMPFLGGGGVGRASFASGTSSLGLLAGRASSVSSVSTTRTNLKMKSGSPLKKGPSGARGGTMPNRRGAAAGGQRSRKRGAKGKDDADESFDEADEDGTGGSSGPKIINEEVITAQKSESGRQLYARLYNIRAYMQYVQQTAEEWSLALAREERHKRRRAEGLPSDTEEEDDLGEDSSGSDEDEEDEEENEGLSEGNTDDQHHGEDDENSDGDTTTTNIKVLEGEWGAPSTGSKQGNVRRRTSSRATSGAREDSTFSPRSTATSSANATPRLRKRSGGKRRKDKGGERAGAGGGGGGGNARDTKNSPNREKRGSPPPKPSSSVGPRSKSPNSPRHHKQVTNAEKLASLMRYLSPSNFAEAVSGKPLPPGVFISPFGVGGTPAKGTPRGRDPATPSAVEAEQSTPRTKTANTTATPQSSVPTSPRGAGGGNSPRKQATTEAKNPNSSLNALEGLQDALTAASKGVPFEGRKSLRPANTFADGTIVLPSLIAVTAEGHSIIQHLNAALAAHRRQRGLYSFPTAEELSGVCTDGTTSFEFFLPSEGEYLLEIVVADLVQLSPGDEWKCVVLATSTFAPFFATVEETDGAGGDEGRGGDGSNAEDDDGDGEADGEENSADEASAEA